MASLQRDISSQLLTLFPYHSKFSKTSIRVASSNQRRFVLIKCQTLTCRNCKKQFAPSNNSPTSCSYHTAHFGGETKRKFEGVYSGGTMETPDGGKVTAYWHCCGNKDEFNIGCQRGPHLSYDD